ncbi:MAG: hypothetical protein KGS61_16545, partial [Verrucomicrobia bacterium]|nr:hypothetical protein [Verrucomicrobiota bacterium]
MLVAVCISTLVGMVVAVLSYYSGRSFAAMANYVDLEKQSQNALNVMTRDVRQADYLMSCVTNSAGTNLIGLTFSYDGTPLQYSYDPVALTLTRTYNGVSQTL